MATLQDYKDRVFAAHPELLDEFLNADIEDATAARDEAQAELDSLNFIKEDLHPVQASAPEVQPLDENGNPIPTPDVNQA